MYVVIAAGNDSALAKNFSPYSADAICVSASTIEDKRYDTSNYGDGVTLFAPGAKVKHASPDNDTKIVLSSGTSAVSFTNRHLHDLIW